MKLLGLMLALASVAVMLVLAAPATASTQTYRATFVEVGGAIPGGSCGSATISELGHVAYQCVAFEACGPNCEVRTITFDDGSTLLIHESIVGVISPGNSAAAGANAPQFWISRKRSSAAPASSQAQPAAVPGASISPQTRSSQRRERSRWLNDMAYERGALRRPSYQATCRIAGALPGPGR